MFVESVVNPLPPFTAIATCLFDFYLWVSGLVYIVFSHVRVFISCLIVVLSWSCDVLLLVAVTHSRMQHPPLSCPSVSVGGQIFSLLYSWWREFVVQPIRWKIFWSLFSICLPVPSQTLISYSQESLLSWTRGNLSWERTKLTTCHLGLTTYFCVQLYESCLYICLSFPITSKGKEIWL